MNNTFNFSTSSDSKNLIQLYVGIDDMIALEDEQHLFIFDGLSKKSRIQFEGKSIFEIADVLEPYVVQAQFNSKFKSWLKEISNNDQFSRWFELNLTSSYTDQPVSFYVDNSESPETQSSFLDSISPIPVGSDTATALEEMHSWEVIESAKENQITVALSDIKGGHGIPSEFKHNVYNVGQGSLSAITSLSNDPLIYFDLGGGWRFNKQTYPRPIRLCTRYVNTTVISHWDFDHLETARRYMYTNWNQFNGMNWIVPKQKITTSYFKLAAKMQSNGNLLLWDNIPAISFWGGQLIRCTGPDKNHSGIALIVEPPTGSFSRILNPADAAYMYIPGIMSLKFDGLIASHHGAQFDFSNSPVPSTISEVGCIAYSHGNRYGHPHRNSKMAHQTNGWTNELETPHGAITFSTSPTDLAVPCGNRCDLDIQQFF